MGKHNELKYMSSEESGIEDGEEVNIVRPLPWLSPSVAQFKSLLNNEIAKEKVLKHGDKLRSVSKALPQLAVDPLYVSLNGLSPELAQANTVYKREQKYLKCSLGDILFSTDLQCMYYVVTCAY